MAEGPQFKRGDGSVDGRPGIVFTTVKQPHIDTRQLTDDVAEAFAEVESSLPADIIVNSELFRLKNFIDRGIFNVAEALVIGATLVIIVLFLFLLNFRTTFITLTAIPLSLVLTTLVFRLIGFLSGSELSINVMTLGGIAVAMGELVDDAIVDVENIFRRLKQNNKLPTDRSRTVHSHCISREQRDSQLDRVWHGGRDPFFLAAVCIVRRRRPFVHAVGRRLHRFDLGVVCRLDDRHAGVVVLLVAAVPCHSPRRRWISSARIEEDWRRHLIRLSMALPRTLLILTWLVVGIAAWQMSQLGRNFLPPFDEGSIQVNVTLPPGSSLDASNQVSGSIDSVFQSMQKTGENAERRDSALRSANGTGRDGRTRLASQRRRIHPEHESGIRNAS